MDRNYSIDTLRSVATILVVLLHVAAVYVLQGMKTENFGFAFQVGNIVDAACRISVPLFVLISGMFLLGRQESFKISYKKRASRIFIPMIAWSIIYILYKMVRSYVVYKDPEISLHLKSLIMGEPFFHMWYLYMVIGLYFITPFINYSLPHISRKYLWYLALTLTVVSAYQEFYDLKLGNEPFFLLEFLQFIGYFLLGYLLKDEQRQIPVISLVLFYALTSIVIALLSVYTAVNWGNLYFYAYPSPFVVIGSLCIFKMFTQLSIPKNALSKLAPLSFGIYLIHGGIIDIMNKALLLKKIDLLDNPMIGIPIKFVFVMLISILIAYVFSKNSYLKRII